MSGPTERANSKAGSNLENAGSERDEIAAVLGEHSWDMTDEVKVNDAWTWVLCCECGDQPRLAEGHQHIADAILASDWLAERDRRTAATAVREFAHWVSVARAHNGSDHERGQSLYNESLNAVLPTWALEWADEQRGRNQ